MVSDAKLCNNVANYGTKNVVFAMVKNRCVRYGCVRYDGTPLAMLNETFWRFSNTVTLNFWTKIWFFFPFFLFQDDFLLHLDPHLSQDKVDLTPEDFNLDSYHSKNPRKLHFSKMDPRSVNIFQYVLYSALEIWPRACHFAVLEINKLLLDLS